MSQKIIVFDGPENTFKTPLARVLSEKTGIPVFKNRKEKDIFKEEDGYYYEFKYSQSYITQFLEQTKHSVIFDRSWPSQFVYSKLTGRNWDPDDWRVIDERYSNMNTYVVVPFRYDYTNCVDDLFNTHEIEMQHNLYEEFMRVSKCKNKLFINVDTIQTDSDLQQKADEVLKFVESK